MIDSLFGLEETFMGLTIHYSFNCKGSVEQAQHAVTELHRHAKELAFKEVSPVVELDGNECDFEKVERDDPNRWLLIQARQLLTPGWVEVKPTKLIAFSAWPGEGCEQMNIGLCRYPAAVLNRQGVKTATKLKGWSWASFCKSQYASSPSVGDVANFVRCHLSVIGLLDKAKAIGVLGEVTDEGGFYSDRNVERLIREVTRWNESMAGLAGVLKDHIGPDLKAAISSFPNFEHLEAKGRDGHGDDQPT
jgi:hypothetical protein